MTEELRGDGPPAAEAPVRRRRGLLIILIALALVALGVGAFALLSGRTVVRGATVGELRSLYESGRYADAVREGRRAVETSPTDLDARRVLALALAARGDNQGAIAQYDAVLVDRPRDHTSLFRRALLERVVGDTKSALRDLKSAVSLSPASFSYQEELAKTYEMAGDEWQATKVWEALVAVPGLSDQQRISYLRQLAATYARAGRNGKAREAWEEVLRLAPDDPQARQQLGR